jgi:hypothetical protein
MLGHESRLESIYERAQRLEMFAIQRIACAETESDSVHAQGIAFPDACQQFELRAAGRKKILAVHLHPRKFGPFRDDLLVVRSAQADPGACRDRPGVLLATIRRPD